jgi:4'-phosphopantetheinyl transferase
LDRIDTKVKFNRDEIHVWLASLDISSQLLGELGSTLSADEIARAKRFYFQHDRRRFVSRRGILRAILAKYLETKPSALRFVSNEFGKPRVEDSQEACNVSFNLSHSGELVLIAVAIDRDVGVDVEFIDNSVPYEEIASRFFSVNEIAALGALPQSLRPARFFNCWARKEAYIKARGRGLSIPLDSFDVWPIKGETATSVSIEKSTDTSNWKIENLKIDSRYAAAVAAAGQDWKVAQWNWGPGLGLPN